MAEEVDGALDQASHIVGHASTEVSARPAVQSFFDEGTNTVTFVVYDPAERRAAIIDSVLDYDASAGRTSRRSADNIISFIEDERLMVDWLFETHAHADHLSAAPYLQEKLGGQLAISAEIVRVQEVFGKLFNAGTEFERDGSQFDRLLSDGDRFAIGALEGIVLHVPGHTPADMALVVGDAAFVGDTIFMPDFGTARADFPGGDARQLFRSVRRMLTLPPQTRVFVGHDYKAEGREQFAWETTVAEQRSANKHVREGISEDDFVEMRTRRDRELPMPKLIMPAVQVNIRGGRLPDPEENGVSYIKVPLNAV